MKVRIHRVAIAFVLASLISTSVLASTKQQTTNVSGEDYSYITDSLKRQGYKFVPNQQLSFKKINVFQDDQDNEDNVISTLGNGYDSDNNLLNLKLSKGQSGTYYEDNSTNSDRISALEPLSTWTDYLFVYPLLGSKASPYGSDVKKSLGTLISNNSNDFTDSKYTETNTSMDQFQKNKDYYNSNLNWDSFDNGKDKLQNHIILVDTTGKYGSADTAFNAFSLYTRTKQTSFTILGAGGTIEKPEGTVKYTAKPFALDRTVVAHEYSHGVLTSIINFGINPKPESNGLSEGLADVFASAITGKWVMGDQTFNVASDNSSYIRDLTNPSKYNLPNDPKTAYPSKYSDLNDSTVDGHISGTILGHQFYLMSQGGNYNGQNINGIGKDVAAKIVFNSLAKLPENPNFADYRNVVEKTATELYGSNSKEYHAVVDSMNATEMPTAE